MVKRAGIDPAIDQAPPRACDPECRVDPKGVCARGGCRYDVAKEATS